MLRFTGLFFAMTLFVASAARADSGFVFTGDLDGDGIEDKIESGPPEMFGNGGGPFLITLGVRKGVPKPFVLGFHPLAVTIEKTRDGVRLWSYWHLSADFGNLCVTKLAPKAKEECVVIYTGSDGTPLGNALYQSVFAEGRRLELKEVFDYKVPPHPGKGSWGDN